MPKSSKAPKTPSKRVRRLLKAGMRPDSRHFGKPVEIPSEYYNEIVRRDRKENWTRDAFYRAGASRRKFFLQGKGQTEAYLREAKFLKPIEAKRMPPVLFLEPVRKEAMHKLEILREMPSYQRYDTLARVMRELGKKNIRVGQEAMHGRSPFSERGEAKPVTSLRETLRSRLDQASSDTNWDHTLYNCRIFLRQSGFEQNQSFFQNQNWGKVANSPEGNVLGIQIFDPDPKMLLRFAKLMAQKRPKDPIVILDIFGNVFYP